MWGKRGGETGPGIEGWCLAMHGLAGQHTGLGRAGQTMEGIAIRNLRPDQKIWNHKILRSDFHFQTITLAAVS